METDGSVMFIRLMSNANYTLFRKNTLLKKVLQKYTLYFLEKSVAKIHF